MVLHLPVKEEKDLWINSLKKWFFANGSGKFLHPHTIYWYANILVFPL